jgi:hypothetical protein
VKSLLKNLVQGGESSLLLTEYRAALARIEAFTAPRFTRFSGYLKCQKGCDSCCVAGLSLLPVEALSVMEHVEKHGLSSNVGMRESHCVFLDAEGSCAIYEARPVVCRTQGLPLLLGPQSPEEPAPGSAENTSELRIVGESQGRKVVVCPLNFTGEEAAAAGDAVLDAGAISTLLFTVDQRFRQGLGMEPDAERVPMADLVA